MKRSLAAFLYLLPCLGAVVSYGGKAAQNEDKSVWYLPLVSGDSALLSGLVLDAQGPVPGAVVRVQTTTNFTTTDADGRFLMPGLDPGAPVRLTAWADGYYIGGGQAYLPGDQAVTLFLTPLAPADNANYAWLSAHAASGLEASCEHCHSDGSGQLPYDEWLTDAHSQTTHNQRFLTMYLGTDRFGNQSPLTERICTPDYGCYPLPPDPNKPYYGPGYKLDFPNSAGNCAACHAPAAAVNNPLGVDPSRLTGVDSEGVACDFCHKIWDVQLDPETGLPQDNMPGVLSYELRRPPQGHQFFAGPFDDVAPGEDTYSPLQRESAYCAPCHTAVFWGTRVYNSYGEWLDSPYSDPGSGQTCQDCHMPPNGSDHFARLDQGGLRRDPHLLASHRMPGAADEALLQAAVTMDVAAERDQDEVQVTVTIINDQTGHHVPTGSPLRHLLLLVEAEDSSGAALTQLSGPVVPDWGGVGDPEAGYYSGLPGTGYAKILQERWTNVSPSGAYWNHTVILSDNRLPAMGSDQTQYVFAAPATGSVDLAARLLFRRAFITLSDQKSWPLTDILMEQTTLHLPAQ